MITFVQYYEFREGCLVEPCGDRSIVILDGRRSLSCLLLEAIECNGNHRPVYDAFQIFKGETLSRGVKSLCDIQFLKG